MSEHDGERTRFRVLHALRVKGAADPGAVQTASGLADPAPALATLVQAGEVVERRTAVGVFYALTPAGLTRHRLAVDGQLDAGARAVLAAAYDERFLPVNVRFKALCTRWQEVDDPFEVLEEALQVGQLVGAFLQDAERVAPHLVGYRRRLEDLLERVQDGDTEAYVAPAGESYHNVWFELHEDLIVTLGRSRSDELA